MDSDDDICDEELRFKAQAKVIYKLGSEMLEEHYGERCEEYAEGCECCERWRTLDRLVREW